MFTILDLKQIERKAFRSTYQDGLMDILLGTVIIGMSLFVQRPETGYSAINLIWFLLTFFIAQSLYQAGKKFITLPRMGHVRFGSIRQQRNITLAIVMGLVVLLQAVVVGLTVISWRNPNFGMKLFGSVNLEHLAVSALASLFVGPSMLVIAYLTDFNRGYYIAILMALAVFLIVYTNQFIYPLIIGGLIIVIGLVLFIRFLRKFPLRRGEESNG